MKTRKVKQIEQILLSLLNEHNDGIPQTLSSELLDEMERTQLISRTLSTREGVFRYKVEPAGFSFLAKHNPLK